jgi:hypothetical protein
MSIEISDQAEARIVDEARRQGVSVDELLDRLMTERGAPVRIASTVATVPELPRLHLGAMGPLHRRDLYDDDAR